MTSGGYDLGELNRESRMGGLGTETDSRQIPVIDMSDFPNRKSVITDELWAAARDVGFFQLANHGFDRAAIDRAFTLTGEFFALPEETKARWPFDKARNAGWESRSQLRPSTGTPDQKESFQITRSRMAELWPSDADLADFQAFMLDFEAQSWELAMRVLECFADRLGFDTDFFRRAHSPKEPDYQSTLRLLHYYPLPPVRQDEPAAWRAGAHTDYDCLTLLFQQEGQGGLQVLPGAEAEGQAWTPVDPSGDRITCNIGDMLMRWSEDELSSNFHRVKSPTDGSGDRYSIAFFAQANSGSLIEGPHGKYAAITAGDYLQQRISANFTPR